MKKYHITALGLGLCGFLYVTYRALTLSIKEPEEIYVKVFKNFYKDIDKNGQISI